MTSATVLNLSCSNFETEVLNSPVPVLVDFWAEWCGPCKLLSPVLDRIAQEKGDSIKIVKVNVEDESALARQFSVSNLPALVYFKGGQVAHRCEGVQTQSQIVHRLEKLA
jgi:thioredoxin 1